MHDPGRPSRETWNLSQGAFDQLLARLDSDRQRAGRVYENIRHKLTRYFEWRGALNPDELADRTMDRVARRIEEGVDIWTGDPYLYFRGVAFRVLQETWRSPSVAALPPALPPSPEELLQRFEQALESIPAEERALIEQYYLGDQPKSARKNLAKQLKLSPNALRIRICRVREKLARFFQAGVK